MKIPHSYLVIDDKVFFQAQNKSPREGPFGYIGNQNGYSVKAFSYPERATSELYLNGNEQSRSYNIVRFPLTELKHYLTIIKEHNARLTNV